MGFAVFGLVAGVAFAVCGLLGRSGLAKVAALLLLPLALPIMAFGWLCNRALEREVARMDDSDEIAS